MEFDYKTLELLRKNARLNLKSYFEVQEERDVAIDTWRIMKEQENCDIGINYSKADQLEANLRFNRWKLKVCGDYLDYKGDLSLDDFAMELLKQKEKPLKRALKRD